MHWSMTISGLYRTFAAAACSVARLAASCAPTSSLRCNSASLTAAVSRSCNTFRTAVAHACAVACMLMHVFVASARMQTELQDVCVGVRTATRCSVRKLCTCRMCNFHRLCMPRSVRVTASHHYHCTELDTANDPVKRAASAASARGAVTSPAHVHQLTCMH